jgi:hypothetical protein
VITAYKLGDTPEEIASSRDVLCLADIDGAIAYYLRHTTEVVEYLRKRQVEAEELRRLTESRVDRQAIRDRLLARRAMLRTPDRAAPPGGRCY